MIIYIFVFCFNLLWRVDKHWPKWNFIQCWSLSLTLSLTLSFGCIMRCCTCIVKCIKNAFVNAWHGHTPVKSYLFALNSDDYFVLSLSFYYRFVMTSRAIAVLPFLRHRLSYSPSFPLCIQKKKKYRPFLFPITSSSSSSVLSLNAELNSHNHSTNNNEKKNKNTSA